MQIDKRLSEQRFSTTPWRAAGLAVPVFSLRSTQSMGVGDFADLKMMVDWAEATSQKMIQILPINDTTMSHTWEDSYPYNANSIFALHPQYIAPREVGRLKDRELEQRYQREAERLNDLEMINYPSVMELKESYMHSLYSEMGADQLASKDYRLFFSRNQEWLEPYALFSLLRDRYSTADFSRWGEYSCYSQELLDRYRLSHTEELGYYYFVQYNLHLQLTEAREYARSKGIAFKGDIPIGVSRTSVDVWVSPELFHTDSQAGAPPDDFAIMGQNWGFPTYNWKEMAGDGYSWWTKRFQKMAEYFDAYRIDHILGFFRIWEIPFNAVDGLLGHFSPAMPYSREELRDDYGFYFEEEYIQPAINDWIVGEFFKERCEEVKERYLEVLGGGRYALKREYDTQRKIVEHFSGRDSREDVMLCEALMSLHREVLFIEDPYQKGRYHPRIAAQNSYKYRAMGDYDKGCFNRLYDNFYYHRHNDFWKMEAMKKLPTLVGATDMLTCGEDLGMIPSCVPSVMESEKILSLEIQRMPKSYGEEFGRPLEYPYMSVATTSTHDMNPIRAWLLEDKVVTKRYLHEMYGVDVEIGDDIDGEICEKILEEHLQSPAMWTILPLQDWLSMNEGVRCKDPHSDRINIPAKSRHYWRYRMHLTIEELLVSGELNDKIRLMVERSGR